MVRTLMRVALIAKPGQQYTGVGRYVQRLEPELRVTGMAVERIAPALPPLPAASYALLRRLKLDLAAFLSNYPIGVRYPDADVYHFTSQNLATLLLLRRPRGRVVVTVHDILPYMLRKDPQLCVYRTPADRVCDRLAMAGLQRADHLVADSQYTKQCVVEHLGITPERITVVYLGIDHARFQPRPVSAAVRTRYGLPEGRRYLIYVGSEDPRKNLVTLVRALAEVRHGLPDVELVKVGRAHFEHERRRLVNLAAELGLQRAIHWLDDVPENDLPALYSLADVCVMPSLYEGFGFPALEAMACGTPLVCARAASLPELVGDASLLFAPESDGVTEMAGAIRHVLDDQELYQALRARGLARAVMFQWSHTARQMSDLFRGAVAVSADANFTTQEQQVDV